ncbi:MAG: hypothetical protein JNK05_10220 [Myxococcales bacterium]|nr:hypothetical protein [Myxococcales bacterium]
MKKSTNSKPRPRETTTLDRHQLAMRRARWIFTLCHNQQVLDETPPRFSRDDIDQLEVGRRLVEDLGLDLWAVAYLIETEFGLSPSEDAREELRTVGDVFSVLESRDAEINARFGRR